MKDDKAMHSKPEYLEPFHIHNIHWVNGDVSDSSSLVTSSCNQIHKEKNLSHFVHIFLNSLPFYNSAWILQHHSVAPTPQIECVFGVQPMKHSHRHEHDTYTSTPVIICGNDKIEWNVCLVLRWRKLILSELILVKIELKVKWFMFGFIHVKVSWTINLSIKINSRIKISNLYLQIQSIWGRTLTAWDKVSMRVSVQTRHRTDTSDYIQLIHFLTLLPMLTCHCKDMKNMIYIEIYDIYLFIYWKKKWKISYSGLFSSGIRSGKDIDLRSISMGKKRGNLVMNIITRVIGRRRRWKWWWLWYVTNNELNDVIWTVGFGRRHGWFWSVHFIQIWKSRNGMKRRRIEGRWKWWWQRKGQRERERWEKDWLRQKTRLASLVFLFSFFFLTLHNHSKSKSLFSFSFFNFI